MCRSALSTMPSAVGQPCFSTMSFSSEPALTPMRMGTFRSRAARTTSRTRSREPMLPGLRRMAWIPASRAESASRQSKWMSATSGTGVARTSSGSAAASSRLGTATRTTSAPASASARICASVPAVSLVSVVVIDWTTMGAPPPMGTLPTRT